jgi:cytochrome c biogenesis protein CcmG, thiol:disulfide interchange protein DsbE
VISVPCRLQPRTRPTRSALALAALFCSLIPVPCSLLSGCNRTAHPGSIGDPAPAFTIHNGTQSVSLSDDRGRIVVLNFWASWCAPCLEEFPSLMQLQQQMPNVAVLAIAFQTDEPSYRQYLLDNHITGITTAVDLANQSSNAFGTTRPPESYIIDRKGVIRRKIIGPINWTDPEMLNYLKNL